MPKVMNTHDFLVCPRTYLRPLAVDCSSNAAPGIILESLKAHRKRKINE